MELCWILAGETLLKLGEPCWNLAGTLLLEPLAGTFCWEPMRAAISFFFLHCFLLCLMCRVVPLEVWLELCWNRFAALLPCWNLYENNFKVFLGTCS